MKNVNFINNVASENMVVCPNCGAAFPYGGKFCGVCGTKLVIPQPKTVVEEPVKEEALLETVKEQPIQEEVLEALPTLEETAPEVPVFESLPEQPVQEEVLEALPTLEDTQPAFGSVSEQPKEEAVFEAASQEPVLEALPTLEDTQPAFESVEELQPIKEDKETVFVPVQEKKTNYVEPVSVFAQGLPEWDLVPPQIMVRRH